MLDAISIAEGTIAGVSSKKALDVLENNVSNNDIHTELICIKELLTKMLAISLVPDVSDVFKVVTLYKSGLGPNYIPRGENHEFIRILVPVSTPLNVTTIFGTFVFTVSPGVWTSIDFPDGSNYILDSTATVNQQAAYVRFTNRPPSN